ncbi:VOC family protein [Cellulomonas soli]|uniref:VOC family protein n=1 Tax=Cellulomonas soli TaxID=931535 RepID=UPI003F85A129
MASTFRGLTFDAHDAHATAVFWAAVLGRDIAPGASTARAELLDDPVDHAPRIVFEQVLDGHAVHGALRLDLVTPDLTSESERLVRLGARRLGRVTAGTSWVTLTDPEGNPFDLVAAA